MKLFEINTEIDKIMNDSVDEESGEWIATDEMLERLQQLSLDKEEIIKYLVQLTKEAEYNIKVCKEAKKEMAEKQTKFENRHSRLVDIIDRELNGEKRDYGFAKVSYRKTESVQIDDEIACIESLFFGGHEECLKRETHIKKPELKNLIKNQGVPVDGCHIESNISCSVK